MRKADQKKILILGGTKHVINVVETMKQLGMSPIVADNVIGSPAKSYADKFFNTSIADVEGLREIVRNEKVDCVYTAFDDINTWIAVALCKKTGLPFYVTERQTSNTTSMDRFEEICRRFGVSVINYDMRNASELEETTLVTWEFPIIAKPLKSSQR